MSDARARGRAEYVAFRLQTANELMKLLRDAESTAENDPAFSHYRHELYRLRNHLTLQIKNTLKVE